MLGRLTRGVPSAAAVAKRSLGLFAAPAVSASFSSVSAPKNSNNSSSDRCSSSSSALKPATAGRRGPLAAFFSSSATASPSSSGANVVGSEAPSAATATSTVPIDPTILTTVAEAHANVQAQVDALVQETGIVAVPVVPPRQTVAHIFIRFDVRQGVFDNSISISLPETTPASVMSIIVASLTDALKDRPDGLSFKSHRLPTPEFIQTGANWNRFQYSVSQREVDGALDPYVIQAIVLDALTNRADAKIVSSNSMGQPGRAESVTYVVTVNVQADCIDYNGTYRWNSLT